MTTLISVPLINPNEREVVLTGLFVNENQIVKDGELIATIESTKSTMDINSERTGYIRGLTKSVGDALLAGDILCFITENINDPLPDSTAEQNNQESDASQPAGLRITAPALSLARDAQLDLSTLPHNRLITATMIKDLLGIKNLLNQFQPSLNSVLIYGGGGHGKSIIELIQAEGKLDIIGLVDDGKTVAEKVLELQILGGSEILNSLRDKGVSLAVNAVGGIGNISSRLRVFELLKNADFRLPGVVHPSAVVEHSALVKDGSQIFALAYIGSSARIGFGSIINTGAIISHDCVVGDYSNISPGAILAGNVIIGEKTMIGMGVTINMNVKIGVDARIGNGATIKSDVPAGTVVKAGTIWPA